MKSGKVNGGRDILSLLCEADYCIGQILLYGNVGGYGDLVRKDLQAAIAEIQGDA